LASATSEAGVGGDLRRSIAAVAIDGEARRLVKQATTVSYGEYADGYLITARRSPDAAASDQVLGLTRRDQTDLRALGEWDTMGMRGTCSPALELSAGFAAEQILPVPFGDIAARTMVPWSHLLWSACWSGIAADALSRARRYLRKRARSDPDANQPGASHLAEGSLALGGLRAMLERALAAYEAELLAADEEPTREPGLGLTVEMNNLKLSASTLSLRVAEEALSVTGMAGYSEASPVSVARHLRDLHSARLMISNDRLHETNGRLLLVHAE
jgi:acyl-CoA dehydrogenase